MARSHRLDGVKAAELPCNQFRINMENSAETWAASEGRALPWILDHYLRYPASYEIPLRTMYSLNCNPAKQPLSSPLLPSNVYTESAFASRSSTNSSKSTSSSTVDSPTDPATQFRAQLITQIARLPSQPCTLPASFVTSFLRRCFAPRLEEVDFNQALTALDYLKDFENRRRKEVVSALQRLYVDPHDLHQMDELAKKYPGVCSWILAIECKGKKLDALYTQVFIGLRRWTLINEILLEPFSKANCIAMLNTLFPPVTDATPLPTVQLTHQILKSQRDGFFRYILAFQSNGKHILERLITQGARQGEENGWPLVRDALDKYLRLANEIIDECATVNVSMSLNSQEQVENGDRRGRKVDSGISLGSSRKLSSAASSNYSVADLHEKPLPPSPGANTKAGSTLERLARELKRLGDTGKSMRLKKMRSTSALSHRHENLPNKYSGEESYFDIDENKRSQLIWEATRRKVGHAQQSSHGSR